MNQDRTLINQFTERKTFRSTIDISLVVGGVVACFVFIFTFPSALTFAFAFIFIGALQHHISIIQHETVHYFLFRSQLANNIVGSLAGFSTGFTMKYRDHHLVHHRILGEPGDPDFHNYDIYPMTKTYLAKTLFMNLSGLAAISQFLGQIFKPQSKRVGSKDPFDKGVLGIIVVQSILLCVFWSLGAWHYYFLFWILPLITIAKTLSNFRNMAEHIYNPMSDGKEKTRLRTIYCNPIERFLFAPLNFNYHAEHHIYMSVPYYYLPVLHNKIKDQSDYVAEVDIRRGYVRTVLNAIS